MKSLEFRLNRLAAVIGLCALSFTALADQTWKGTTDNLWTSTANWSGNALPGSTDLVIYNATSTGNLSNWLSQAFSIKGIMFTNPAGPVSINSANTLTLAGSGINMTNATQPMTIFAPVALGASQTWSVATNQVLSVSGAVSGGFGCYKTGGGMLFLNAANSFTGSFTNDGGAVWINNSSALGSGTKQISVANNNVGAGLHLNGTNGSIILASGLSYTLSQQNGAIFNEAGDNTISGNMSVFSGGGYAYILVNAGTLTLNGTVTLGTSARPFTLGGAGNGTLNGAMNGTSFPFRKVDAGTWTMTNNNTYSGYTTVEGGTLLLKPTAKINSTANITVFANATLDVSAVTNASFGSNVFVLTANQILAGSGTVTGNVATASSATIQPGSLNVAQTAGGMGVAGTLSLSNSLTLGSTVTNYFELNTPTTVGSGINDLINVGGNLDPQSARIFVTALSAFTTGSPYRLFNYSGAKPSSFNSAVLTDTHYTFTLDESVPNQVNVTVNSGPTLLWTASPASSVWDLNTTANWNNNSLKFLNFDPVAFDDTAATNFITLTGTLKPQSVAFTNSALNYLLQGSGKITGPTGLGKWGSGTLIITTTGSDYTGPVTVSGGVLGVSSVALNGSSSSLGAGTNITLDGGTFQFGGARPAASSFNRLWTLGPNGGTVLSTNGTFFIMNTISGPGSLTKTGTAQVILGDIVTGVLTNAINTYTGNTYVAQGELQIRNARALGYGKAVVSSGADLAVGGGASYGTITNNMDLNGGDGGGSAGTLQVNDGGTAVTFGGTINLLADSSVGTVNNGNAVTFNISGPITGPGGLKKLGTNTVTLTSASSSYSGATTLSAGTFALGGSASISTSPSISIAAGATLDVSAISAYSLAGGQSLSCSGTASPATIKGASSGTVNLGSRPITLTYDGSHPALTDSQGTLVLNGNPFTVNGSALAPGTYAIIQASGNISGSGAFSVTGTAIGAGKTGSISVSGANVNLIIKANPAFSNLAASQSVTYGATSVTLSGKVSAAGPIYPAVGETITITVNGNAQTTTINDATGDFSFSFNPSGIPYSAAAYPITYSYAGDASLNSASDTSTALTVNTRPLDITANNATKECSQSLTFAGTEFTTGAGQLVNGNSVASATLTSSGTASGAATGTYNIVPSAAVGSGLGNYSIAYHNGTLTVADTTPPAIIYSFTNLTLSTTSSNCQAVLPDLTGTNYIIAVDSCSSSVTVTQNPAASTFLSLGTNEVVLTAFDASGNATNSTNTVVVLDTVAPVVTLLGDTPLTNECHSPFIDPGATALDNCAGVVSVATNGAVNPNAVGVYTIDYVASDPSGNTATNTRTVYVTDTTAPVITLNGANPLMVECHSGFSDPGATALDACAGPVAVTVSGSVDANSPGAYTLTYTADDGNGNTNRVTRAVNVQDTLPPAIVYYFTNLTLSATSTNCQALLPDLTGTNYLIAVDGCSSSVTVTQNPPANTWLPLGTNQVVLTAFDPSGNATNSTNAVIVVDTTPPVITCPAAISVVTTDPSGAAVSFTVTASDACDPSPTIISTPASGSFFLAGTNTVTAYASDSSGNTNTCSFLVMVDRAPIVLTNVSAYPLENQLLTLDLAKLLAVVSDPDNDPLAVTAAGPTSTNGGTVTLTSTDVTYLPVANFVGTDLFSYTVGDGRGGFATNTVLVTVLSSNGFSPNVVYGPVVSNGLFIVRFAGIPGVTYTVEATDGLGSPSWTKKASLTAPVTDQGLGVGIFEFSESVGAATSRFYRTVYPSY